MKNKLRILTTEKGMTFVEIMLAVAILAIIAVPLLSSVVASVRNNSTAKEKTEAIALAEMTMENIKAQKAIQITTSPAIGFTSGDLVSYYSVVIEKEGKVEPSNNTTFNYDVPSDNEFDFILEIDQGSNTSDGYLDYVTFNDGTNLPITFTNISVGNKKLDFQLKEEVINSSTKYYYVISYDSKTVKQEFTPKSPTSTIKLKILYINAHPSSNEKLKINTKIDSIRDNIFEVYDTNNEEANAGVTFIPRGKEFTVNYIKNNAFNYGSINSLYKITVKVLKNSVANGSTLKNDDIIYEVSSYVKK